MLTIAILTENEILSENTTLRTWKIIWRSTDNGRIELIYHQWSHGLPPPHPTPPTHPKKKKKTLGVKPCGIAMIWSVFRHILTICIVSQYIKYIVFINIPRFLNNNLLRIIEYIIQKVYISWPIFLYHDTYLIDCIMIYIDTQCILLPLKMIPASFITALSSWANA